MCRVCDSCLIEWKLTSLLRRDFILPLAVILLTGSLLPSARAECGDYVIRHEKAIGEHTSSKAMASLESGQHEPHLPMRHGSPYAPCHGPRCSKDSRAPLVPPTTVAPAAEHWGQILAAFFVPDIEPNRRITAEASQFPHVFARTIYHPPRSSSALRLSLS